MVDVSIEVTAAAPDIAITVSDPQTVEIAVATQMGVAVDPAWADLLGRPTILVTLGGLANAVGVLSNNGAGALSWVAPQLPAGADKSIQMNDNGAFGATPGVTYDDLLFVLKLTTVSLLVEQTDGGTSSSYNPTGITASDGFNISANNDVVLGSLTGAVRLSPGATALEARRNAQGAQGPTIYLPNLTNPPSSNPSGGGLIYVEGGALKYRSPAGTVTTIAPN